MMESSVLFQALALLVQAASGSDAKGTLHPWSDCKPGSWVRVETRQSDGKKEFDRWEDRTEIVGLEAGKIRLKTASQIRGGKAAKEQEQLVPLAPVLYVPKANMKRGPDETLLLAGQRIACEVWSFQDGQERLKEWVAMDSSKFPVTIVKSEQEGKESVRQAVVAWAEQVKVGDRQISCIVVESRSEVKDLSIEMKTWWSVEAPGFLVKDVSISSFAKDFRQVQETLLVDFGRKR